MATLSEARRKQDVTAAEKRVATYVVPYKYDILAVVPLQVS